jgi:hypothetical protein
MSTETQSNVKASLTEKHISNTINDIIKDHIWSDQTKIVNALIDSGDIDKNPESVNIEYFMFENDEIPYELRDETVAKYVEDRDEIQTQIIQIKSDLDTLKDHISAEEDEDKLTQLDEDATALQIQIEELENKEYELDDKIFDIESASIETFEVERWYLVSDWLIEKLKEHKQIVLTTDFGTWWGVKPSGAEGLKNNGLLVKLIEKFSGK